MANYLTKVQKSADKVRKKLANKGFYEYTVTVAPSLPGDKLIGARETTGPPVTLNPGVEVKKLSETTVSFSAGVLLTGDIELTGVSRIFYLNQAATDTLVNNLGNVWVIEGPGIHAGQYTLIRGQAKRLDTEWVIRLRHKAVQ
jgi:hypothetical protein